MSSLILMCAFGLFAIAQSRLYYNDKIKDYYKCWTYMNCLSDGKMAQKMESCLDILNEEDLELYVKYWKENYPKFQNHTLKGIMSQYCNMEADDQKNLYYKMMDTLQSLEKEISTEPNMKDMKNRGGQSFECVLNYLEKHFPDDDCKIN